MQMGGCCGGGTCEKSLSEVVLVVLYDTFNICAWFMINNKEKINVKTQLMSAPLLSICHTVRKGETRII